MWEIPCTEPWFLHLLWCSPVFQCTFLFDHTNIICACLYPNCTRLQSHRLAATDLAWLRLPSNCGKCIPSTPSSPGERNREVTERHYGRFIIPRCVYSSSSPIMLFFRVEHNACYAELSFNPRRLGWKSLNISIGPKCLALACPMCHLPTRHLGRITWQVNKDSSLRDPFAQVDTMCLMGAYGPDSLLSHPFVFQIPLREGSLSVLGA